ncbi:MAG TPA: HAD family hydrolase, partial [Armatimonadota bacterium]|nr:HAD family hydrolase [Armatimonadota bacterium]
MRQFYVSDLDGTLLRNDATLSPFSCDNLNRMLDAGMAFTAASARSVVSMGEVLKGLNLRLPVIEFNGAFISNLVTGEHLVINELPSHILPDLHDCIFRHRCIPIVSTFNGECDCLYYDCTRIINAGIKAYVDNRTTARDRRLRPVHDLGCAYSDRVVCLTIVDRKETLEPLRVVLHERYGDVIETHLFEDAYAHGWFWLTAHDRTATKDQAIATLARKNEYPLESVAVFGDQTNDVRMFRTAARSVAVSNAVPELKLLAHEIIGSN